MVVQSPADRRSTPGTGYIPLPSKSQFTNAFAAMNFPFGLLWNLDIPAVGPHFALPELPTGHSVGFAC